MKDTDKNYDICKCNFFNVFFENCHFINLSMFSSAKQGCDGQEALVIRIH